MAETAMTARRLISRLLKHGASHVTMAELLAESQIIWPIAPDQDVSEVCVHAEEFMACAYRNCQQANSIVARMKRGDGEKDPDLLTALKKYVEDTCGAIKEVDNALKRKASSLETLLFEIPGKSDDQVSWSNLIGRRDVIAHRLLTVDNERVYREAERDFSSLQELLSRVYSAPTKADFGSGMAPGCLLRTDALNKLMPTVHGDCPRIGNSLVLVFEDVVDGLLCLRMGRTEKNKIALATPRPICFSLAGVESLDPFTNHNGLADALSAARRHERGEFVGPSGSN